MFVVETNEISKTDDVYYQWLFKNFYSIYYSPRDIKDDRVLINFVHMDGKTNYKKDAIKKEIKNAINYHKSIGETFVVYCIDTDTKSIKDDSFLSKIKDYVASNNYYLVLACNEIEAVLKIGNSKLSKIEKKLLFTRNYPKKDAVDEHDLRVDIDIVPNKIGTTNFCLVIDEILVKEFK